MAHMLEVGIEPLDPLLFGDNRSTRAGVDHVRFDQDPAPSALYGAIGGQIARKLNAAGESHWEPARPVLGPFCPDLEKSGDERAELAGYALRGFDGELWFPLPLHFLVEQAGESGGEDFVPVDIVRPADRPESVLSSLNGMSRLAPRDPVGKVKEPSVPLFVSEALLGLILSDPVGALEGEPSAIRPFDSFYAAEHRLGLTVKNRTNANVPGHLFSRPSRRYAEGATLDGWRTAGFKAWYKVAGLRSRKPAEWGGVGFVGGERRRARLSFAEAEEKPLQSLLASVLESVDESEGFLAYLLTPAVAGAALRLKPSAMALGKPWHTSGWSAASKDPGPRPVLNLIPAGSVYFFDWDKGSSAAERRELLTGLWMEPVSESYRNAGFGRMLMGVWK